MSEGVKMQLVKLFRCAKFSFWPNHQGVYSLTDPRENALPLKMLYYVIATKHKPKSSGITASEGEQSALFCIWIFYCMHLMGYSE